MRRRDFITAFSGAVAWALCARAQQAPKMPRVGFLVASSPLSELIGLDPKNPAIRAFVHGLRAMGYVEGKNLVVEWRTAEGKYERFPEIIRELVSIEVDVIVLVTTPMVHAAKEVTQTVPIVALFNNPVEEGLVQSLARPGGNITGLTAMTGMEEYAKRVEVLKELVPGISRVAHLQSKAELPVGWEESAEAVTRHLGVKVLLAYNSPTNYADAFAFIMRERIDAVTVGASAANYANRQLIVDFASKNKLPAIYGTRAYTDAGGLIAYGSDVADVLRRAAGYVDRILKGTKPAELAIDRPTKFLLTINVKTAKALGLTVPPTLLARADEVIE